MKIGRYAIPAVALAFSVAPASAASIAKVSGYEFLLGARCTINFQPGTCGVEFGGWTAPVANGWTPFPGTRQGLWKASVSYTGRAAFGDTVTVVSGEFDLLFTNGTVVAGKVTGGTVEWPQVPVPGNIGCGTDVAKIQVNIMFTRGAVGSGSFQGCLHDLPAGTVIPPKIWGELTTLP
jgi:hypothetical protein